MINDELQTWIRAQSKKLTEAYRAPSVTDREWVYARILKLTEEIGELSAELLADSGWQRQDKLETHGDDSIMNEIADVLICTLLLAEVLKIDPSIALRKKIAKLDKRFADMEAF